MILQISKRAAVPSHSRLYPQSELKHLVAPSGATVLAGAAHQLEKASQDRVHKRTLFLLPNRRVRFGLLRSRLFHGKDLLRISTAAYRPPRGQEF
jgi:hypothetical protein